MAMVSRFYWLVDGVLAGCSRPGGAPRGRETRPGPEHGDPPALDALEHDLAWLRARGIGAVLSLTETPLDAHDVARHELAALHVPVPDLHAPTPGQFMEALSFIDRQRAHGRAVAVHCLVGQGRTGTILAAYRIRSGTQPEQAVREIRALCPGAIGSEEQERALHAFAGRRDWLL